MKIEEITEQIKLNENESFFIVAYSEKKSKVFQDDNFKSAEEMVLALAGIKKAVEDFESYLSARIKSKTSKI